MTLYLSCAGSCHGKIVSIVILLACLVPGTCQHSSDSESEDADSLGDNHCHTSDQGCMSSRSFVRAVMRAIRVTEFGGPEVLKVQTDVPIPQPKASEVLIKVSAAGINPVDTYIRSGVYAAKPSLPYTPGMDVSGVVQEVGADVKKFQKGDRVYSMRTSTGAYAEFATVEEKYIGHLGDAITFEQGAGIGVPYYTAYRALILRGGARPGETVLVHGASGGVGSAAVQIAKSRGIRVLGTAGSAEGMEAIKKNGADVVFNHREEGYIQKIMDATGGEGPDVILEMLANINLEKDLGMIKLRGRIVNIGSRGPTEINPRATMGKECTITGVMLMISGDADWKEMHAAMESGMSQGWLRPVVGKEFPLEKAAETHELIMNTKSAQGNIVLKL
ncbi:quinone oxidoreductase-like isoform X1 [Haliotis rufescens]|uniref:quinone oxidoreductase-like isoform X1 n=2 Tax=Haliotis rufescens TaxID=6454 RepID=UPI00201F3BC0|nr:quinone oxidoreductase-like isoform X1 [Haliotis rufescens]